MTERMTDKQLDALIEKHIGGGEVTDAEYRSMVAFARSIEAAQAAPKPEKMYLISRSQLVSLITGSDAGFPDRGTLDQQERYLEKRLSQYKLGGK